MQKILIIGGVAAGATAAAKVRRLSAEAEITILEAGADISFANCGLPYYLGGDIQTRSSLILQSPQSFHDQYNVRVYTHTAATHLDPSQHLVKTQNMLNGETQIFTYDKLILAQGGRPVQPPITGANQDHVFTLWTLDDMDKIHQYIKTHKPQNAVIAGGGFIGLEMAEALRKRKLAVHVIEKQPHVMTLMDPEMAGLITEEMIRYGVQIHANTGLERIESQHVELDNKNHIPADLVLLSIGVRPTLKLAQEAGLTIGTSGGLQVDQYLQTSDPDIYAAGDMVEIIHRVHGQKIRIPLAGPANRQGRIAAENVLGGKHPYAGALGTSIVRVFEAVAGITGLSLRAAQQAGLQAQAITIHKEHHTSYYPGAQNVSVRLVYEKQSGKILGGQTAGYAGADRRLDVIANAIAAGMTIHDLADVDFAYSPPLGTANDAINMAAYVAQNQRSAYSPALCAEELDNFVRQNNPFVLDVRDIFAYEKGHWENAQHIPLELLRNEIHNLSSEQTFLVYDETGKKGHQALRWLKGLGFQNVFNVSGGYLSMQRHARCIQFTTFHLTLPDIEQQETLKQEHAHTESSVVVDSVDPKSPIIIDVRTPMEYSAGAFPNAVNIPLDELPERLSELGDPNREIILYCASGARSGYAQRLLQQSGFTQVTNGGGLVHMMQRIR